MNKNKALAALCQSEDERTKSVSASFVRGCHWWYKEKYAVCCVPSSVGLLDQSRPSVKGSCYQDFTDFQMLCLMRDSLHMQESAISHGSRRPQTETAGAHQWEKQVISLRQRGRKPQRKDAGGKKKRATSQSSSAQTFVCPECSRVCASRIRLYSHQRACTNWPPTFPKSSSARNQPSSSLAFRCCVWWSATRLSDGEVEACLIP